MTNSCCCQDEIVQGVGDVEDGSVDSLLFLETLVLFFDKVQFEEIPGFGGPWFFAPNICMHHYS